MKFLNAILKPTKDVSKLLDGISTAEKGYIYNNLSESLRNQLMIKELTVK